MILNIRQYYTTLSDTAIGAYYKVGTNIGWYFCFLLMLTNDVVIVDKERDN